LVLAEVKIAVGDIRNHVPPQELSKVDKLNCIKDSPRSAFITQGMSKAIPRFLSCDGATSYFFLSVLYMSWYSAREMVGLNLDKVQEYINMGRLVVKKDTFTTMRDLYNVGLISRIKDGIKLLAKVRTTRNQPNE
jgi:hypothetical protein